MRTLSDHIEHVKTKPHHVRQRIAYATAGGTTALIALFWLFGSITLGRFALPSNSFADSAGSSIIATGDETAGESSFAGVASAFPDAAPARIQIVNVATSTTVGRQGEQTTIPF